MYTRLVSFLVLWLTRQCLRAGRYVDYTHQGQLYMRCYAVWGHLTGDPQRGIRSRLPNLYIHQMVNPDLDPCLHDHPWPWAVSWIALGGYRERRRTSTLCPTPYPECNPAYCTNCDGTGAIEGYTDRELRAPALNVLSGGTFHRIAALDRVYLGDHPGPELFGTFTFFLAGPRRRAKQWGYLVPGTGYVHHSERHEEFGGEEKRGLPQNDYLAGSYEQALRDLASKDEQIRSLQKQVVRACELRRAADERASRRGVHILTARIERLETELVQVWHRASGRELRRVLDLANSRGERIAELETKLRLYSYGADESPDSE